MARITEVDRVKGSDPFKSVRRAGLLIAVLGLLALFVLAAYRVPLFHEELQGVIVGISEVHDGNSSELVAAVQLDSGDHVLVPMPVELLKSESNNVSLIERRTLSGRKTYRYVAPYE